MYSKCICFRYCFVLYSYQKKGYETPKGVLVMKFKTFSVISAIVCIFAASHYNDHVTVSVTLPSPAEVVAAVGKVTDEIKSSADTAGVELGFSGNVQNTVGIADTAPSPVEEVYLIRPSWEDYAGQIGAYYELENAVYNCPAGYYVFNTAGEIVFDPNIY